MANSRLNACWPIMVGAVPYFLFWKFLLKAFRWSWLCSHVNGCQNCLLFGSYSSTVSKFLHIPTATIHSSNINLPSNHQSLIFFPFLYVHFDLPQVRSGETMLVALLAHCPRCLCWVATTVMIFSCVCVGGRYFIPHSSDTNTLGVIWSWCYHWNNEVKCFSCHMLGKILKRLDCSLGSSLLCGQRTLERARARPKSFHFH